MSITDVKEIAHQWRYQHGYNDKGGVIVLYGKTVQGWVNELRDPQHWMPGCIAIDETGLCHEATGGNAYKGATHWQIINH